MPKPAHRFRAARRGRREMNFGDGCGRYQANILSKEPIDPVLARRVSAVPPVCSASAELNRTAVGELVETAVDDPAEGLAPLVEEAVVLEAPDAVELLEEELEELAALAVGATGWKLEFWAPKPTFGAKRPPTETETFSLLPVTTSSPLLFSDALTFALVAMFGLLMALIRSATVSVPVEVNVVVLVPSPTVIIPFSGIPRVRSDVFSDSGTVPVPVAAEPVVGAFEAEPLDWACEACTALCSAAVSWAWTRVCASLVAIAAKPDTSLLTALPRPVISAALNEDVCSSVCVWLQ